MAGEENVNQNPAPAQVQEPAQNQTPEPQTPAPSQATPPAKKSNGCLIAAIIVGVVVIVLGVGGYFTYRYFKNKINNATSTLNTSSTSSTSSTSNSGSNSATTTYENTKDLTPTDAFSKQINDEAKKIFTTLFGGAKLEIWTSEGGTASYLGYNTKKAVTNEDAAKIEAEYIKAGYTKKDNYNSGDGFIINLDKGTTSLSITTLTTMTGTNGLSITATKSE